jgi:oxygen-independent coproporphyrinogen-3 oxidase
MKNNTYGLYVHIPFCARKCNYCDFLSFHAPKEVRMSYVCSLAKELAIWKETMSVRADTVFLGGGTPSILEPDEMDVVFQAIHDNFSPKQGAEFTVECNPGTVTEEKFRLMKRAGVNRISFGMQSSINRELKILGRIHTYDDFLKGYQMARRIGFDNIPQFRSRHWRVTKKVCFVLFH